MFLVDIPIPALYIELGTAYPQDVGVRMLTLSPGVTRVSLEERAFAVHKEIAVLLACSAGLLKESIPDAETQENPDSWL